ncbi:hypothetical protein LTR91_021142 [Friedmanniomyces endolithicus]|uniref:Methyltransferase type 11 domain-containing protein n=1 Tax=Friedmanniomyces endolithicus TaxID=329885 RepID=A0AAN6H7Z3_9PEZI|nr:hypothetical protein LTR94_001511 [Friedmanniomyces endolithicus]KAK0772269.1 hypothetical protein LTR38_016949 [Friedmanniomyces endolithicus]KAK0778179.1 hypothetical protein LTR75_015728 [Friedmanniomyces endolithicus]KAK0810344.1 hypothetical protein LTR59_002337 [Friedmanniomyces endolithicus]KAK0838780.1 hypothetical protein LTR03_011776 [Friedmanniomyces endolithicus]
MATQDTATVDLSTTTNPTKVSRQPGIYERLNTALRSFRVLKDLTPEQVDSFMKSYVIYDLDWANEKQMIEVLGPDYQKKVGQCLSDYYAVLNHLCAIGELEKMYVPPILDASASVITNQILYEELVASELQLPPNAKVLDIGCGRGRVAAHMTEMTDAHVTGLNIDTDQLASAVEYNKLVNFSNTFVHQDMNELPLPFANEHFDGFYQIQAFSLCKDLPKLCDELFRVLRPGARLSLLDWASLEAYNPKDPHHQELMRCVKPIIGAVGTPTPESMIAALEGAGFRMIRHYVGGINGLQAPFLERLKSYFYTARWAMQGLTTVGLLPMHFRTLFNRMTQDSDAFIEADRTRLITTCYHWVAEKPGGKRDSSSANEEGGVGGGSEEAGSRGEGERGGVEAAGKVEAKALNEQSAELEARA